MRSNIQSILLLAFLLLAAHGAAAVENPTAADDLIWVETAAGPSVFISFSELEQNDTGGHGDLVLTRNALHGTVVEGSDSFTYTPDTNFWSLGTDQFSYTLAGTSTGTSTATVRLLRRFPQELVIEEHFDLSAIPSYTTHGATHLIGELAEANITGTGGLRARVEEGSAAPVFAKFRGGDTTDNGGATLLGCGFSRFPRSVLGPPEEVAILMVGPPDFEPEDASLRVILTRGSGLPELRVEVRDAWQSRVFVPSASIPVHWDVTHLAIQWWDQGAILDVDGLSTTVFGVPNLDLDFTDIKVGLMPVGSGLPQEATLDFDLLKVFARAEQPASTLLKVDNFESGDTASWSDRYGNGLLTTTMPTGEHALETNLDLGISYLVDTTPVAETNLGARLRFDISNLTMTPGDALRIFDVGSVPGPLFGTPDLSLRLLGGAGNKVYLVAYTSRGGVLTTSAWLPLSGEHTVELQLRTSASAQATSGLARIWLDGVVVDEIAELDNDAQLVEWLHLGALGVDAGTSGILVEDDFESWR